MPLLDILNEYGFATMAAVAMGWFIWFIYTFITQEVTKKLGEASTALISLIDKIRRLDNDIIRLRTKLNTIITLQEQEKNKPHQAAPIHSFAFPGIFMVNRLAFIPRAVGVVGAAGTLWCVAAGG